MNIVKRMMRTIRKMSKGTKKRTNKKRNNNNNINIKHQKGGAIYGFDLNDKIGGQAANITLNGTQDGDCPSTDYGDLGFTNYGLTRGGAKRSRKSKSSKSSKKHKCSMKKTKK